VYIGGGRISKKEKEPSPTYERERKDILERLRKEWYGAGRLTRGVVETNQSCMLAKRKKTKRKESYKSNSQYFFSWGGGEKH